MDDGQRTVREIAAIYNETLPRIRLALKRAGIKPCMVVGRTHLYAVESVGLLRPFLLNMRHRTRKAPINEST